MKVGEEVSETGEVELAQNSGGTDNNAEEEVEDTSCGVDEEGQSDTLVKESKPKSYRL